MTPPVTLIARAAGPGREPFLPRGRTAYRFSSPSAGRVAETTSGWGLGAPGVYAEESPPSPGWSRVRAAEPFHLTAGRVLIAFRAVARAEASIAAAQAAALARIRARRLYHRLGFASFGDFVREHLQTSPRSAARRVALHRVFERAPSVRRAFLAGRLSGCRALALGPVLEDPALPFWIELASSIPVRDLESRVRAARRRTAHTDADLGTVSDERGATVTFAAPRSAAIAWEQGMDLARRVLGFEAPRYRCVEAVLDETWPELAASAEAPVPGARAASPPPEAVPASSAHRPSPSTCSPHARARYSQPVVRPSEERLRDLCEALVDTERELSRLRPIIATDHTLIDEGAEPGRLALHLVARAHALSRAERPLRLVKARLLRTAHRAGALRALGHRTLAGFLEDVLGLSERTGRRFLAEAFLFEDEPSLARAYAGGEIGLAHAWLIRRVAVSDTRPAFLRRARAVTALHFEREVRFLEALREFVPSLAVEFSAPLPMPGLEPALIERLCGMGWSVEGVRRALAARQATLDGWEVEGALGGWIGSRLDQDPARHPLAMRRLEILLELLVLAMEEHDVRIREGNEAAGGDACGPVSRARGHGWEMERAGAGAPAGDEGSSADGGVTSSLGEAGKPGSEAHKQRSGDLGDVVPDTDVPTLAGTEGGGEDTRRSMRTETEEGAEGARDGEPLSTRLPMLAPGAGLDVGVSMTTIRFWAPNEVLSRWQWAISAVRGDAHALPTWVAAVLLLESAMREWERAGRVRRPSGWRILERDGWRCQAPGCSARKWLEVHHIRFRSHGGGDEPGNLVTLCHHHHQHGVHGGTPSPDSHLRAY